MDNNTGTVREQFEQEAAALKQIIYEFIDSGHIIMAAQVFEQYIALNPDDPDIAEIKNVLYPNGTESHVDAIPEEFKILNNIETIFILSGIITKRTGYIDSVLRKMKLMEEKWNYKPLLLTCIHNIDQRKAQIWLNTAGIGQVTLGTETRVLNVYEYFQKSYTDGLENKAIYSPDDDYQTISNNVPGVETKEYYTGYMGSLRMVRYFKDGNADKDMVYDDWGYLNYIREYSPISEDIFDIKYFTTDGKLCIEAFFRPTRMGAEHEKLLVYDNNGKVTAECKNSAELAAICLDRLITDEKFYMLVVEDGLMSAAVTTIEESKKNVARCAVVHSIFLNDAYKPESGAQKFYKHLCENNKKFDGIVMLTGESRDDFQKIYGDKNNVFVIPHPYPYEIIKSDFMKRDPLKAVVVARLDPYKQIDLTVEIFSLVVNALPEAKLEIYGRGMEEENIRKQIRRLGLEKNVYLMGYTDEPLAIFNNAVLSVFTSKAEGYGLTIMESICNGCPVFAFDIKYGPSEIIDDGKTGFLFPRFEVKQFALKVVEYLNNESLQKNMIMNCYKASGRFNTGEFLNSWFEMTKSLYEKNRETL